LAEAIIPFLYSLVSRIILSYLPVLAVVLASYFSSAMSVFGTLSSHFWLALVSFTPILSVHSGDSNKEDAHKEPKWKDTVEELGGDGPKVAVYLRKSKKKQSSLSLDAQFDALNKLKTQIKPSRIYWFIDDGKSSKSPKDYDKLKINYILELRRSREITELWVFSVNRMGRVCRKLLLFFLEFCDEGGVIRTPEKTFDLKDVVHIITFFFEAQDAEKDNQERRKAMMSAKGKAFKLKRWNKPSGSKNHSGQKKLPLGYSPDNEWLKKLTEFESLIKEVCRLLHETKCLRAVSRRIGTFGGMLAKPLTADQIRRITSDPLYVGRPEHMGEVVVDPSLAFYDEDTRKKNLEVLAEIQKRWKPKRVGPLMQQALSKPTTFLQLLNDHEIEMRHTRCGGRVRLNGTTNDESIRQQLLSCNGCPKKWRLPPIKNGRNRQTENSMGGLNVDNPRAQAFEKRIVKKGNRRPRCLTLSKSDHSPFADNKIIPFENFGHEISEKVKMNVCASTKKDEDHPKPEPQLIANDMSSHPLKGPDSMDENETRLEGAVHIAISARYQLTKGAFDFLREIATTKEPTKLMEEAIRYLEQLEEKPLFIERSHLEKMISKNTEDVKYHSGK